MVSSLFITQYFHHMRNTLAHAHTILLGKIVNEIIKFYRRRLDECFLQQPKYVWFKRCSRHHSHPQIINLVPVLWVFSFWRFVSVCARFATNKTRFDVETDFFRSQLSLILPYANRSIHSIPLHCSSFVSRCEKRHH